MGLFDVKKEPVAVPQKNGNNSLQVAELEKQFVELEKRQSATVLQIGELFVKENTVEAVRGTAYEGYLAEYIKIAEDKIIIEKRKLAVQGLRKCESCGNILALDSLFCNKCGERLPDLFPQETMGPDVCKQCGSPLEPNVAFCSTCGCKTE